MQSNVTGKFWEIQILTNENTLLQKGHSSFRRIRQPFLQNLHQHVHMEIIFSELLYQRKDVPSFVIKVPRHYFHPSRQLFFKIQQTSRVYYAENAYKEQLLPVEWIAVQAVEIKYEIQTEGNSEVRIVNVVLVEGEHALEEKKYVFGIRNNVQQIPAMLQRVLIASLGVDSCIQWNKEVARTIADLVCNKQFCKKKLKSKTAEFTADNITEAKNTLSLPDSMNDRHLKKLLEWLNGIVDSLNEPIQTSKKVTLAELWSKKMIHMISTSTLNKNNYLPNTFLFRFGSDGNLVVAMYDSQSTLQQKSVPDIIHVMSRLAMQGYMITLTDGRTHDPLNLVAELDLEKTGYGAFEVPSQPNPILDGLFHQPNQNNTTPVMDHQYQIENQLPETPQPIIVNPLKRKFESEIPDDLIADQQLQWLIDNAYFNDINNVESSLFV